jgi:tetratricopeptide (TPR) repeat protein
MLEGFLSFLQSPEFLAFVSTYAGTKLLDTAGSKIKQLKDSSKKKTPEWQFLRCLELAFFTTETELGWEHNTEVVYENFEDSLLTHQGSFTLISLKGVFEAAVEHSITEEQLELWVKNFKKELAMGDYPELLRYINIDHYFQSQRSPSPFVSKYILTRNPPMRENPDIIFRDTIVNDLLEKVSVAGSRTQIAGMGGLGKTEILNKLYAQLAKDKQHTLFDHIVSITFSGEIANDIEAQLDYPRSYLGQQGVEAAKRYLQDVCQEETVLLCIDDIRPNQAILKHNNPNLVFLRSLGASVLLAARVAYPEFEVLDLHFLPTEACISIFAKQYDQTVSDAVDIAILTDIIENRAGNHTMIVNRLGTMAKDYVWSIPTLSEKLKEQNFNFSKGIDDELLQQEISMLYQINDGLCPAEVNILEAFSIFPASPLPIDLCVNWLHEDAGVDEDKCALLLNRLVGQTWLEKRCGSSGSDVYFLMHQLVRTAVQEQLTNDVSKHCCLMTRCNLLLKNSTETYNFKVASLVITFAVSIYFALFEESESFSILAHSIGVYYFYSTDYETSLAWNNKDLSLCKNIYGENNSNTAIAYNIIAEIYKKMGDLENALLIHSIALNIRIGVFGESHQITTESYNNIAGVYMLQEEYKKAIVHYEKSLTINENALDNNPTLVAVSCNNLAEAYHKIGADNESLKLFMRALQLYDIPLTKNFPGIATTYNNIARLLKDQGHLAESIEWNMRSCSIREELFGVDHIETAASYNNIAQVYISLCDFNEAYVWFKKAQIIFEKKFGLKHFIAVSIRNNIECLENKLGIKH